MSKHNSAKPSTSTGLYLYKPACIRGSEVSQPDRLCRITGPATLIPGLEMVAISSADKAHYWSAIVPVSSLRSA